MNAYPIRSLIISAFFFISVCFPSLSLAKANLHPQQQKLKDAIVKIYSVITKPDFYQPWRMTNANSINGSGCIISGHRILTNAHVVADNTFIQVRRHGEAGRYRAHVVWVSHETDLAILSVDDPAFFDNVPTLEIGDLPDTQQEVLVFGFPIGGDSLSITKGILSRIEHQYYTHSSAYKLAGQIDAAINPGNSGGPVIVDGKIVGVVMQAFASNFSENIGYMVPSPIIKHVFKDIQDQRLDGFPDIGINTQRMENPALKRRYKMPKKLTGVLIDHVFENCEASKYFRPGDIILSIDGHTIEDDGTVEFRPKERTWFSYYIDLHQMNESVGFEILRDGSKKAIEMALKNNTSKFMLVPLEQYDQMPRYFIYGGFVFSTLTKNLILQWGKNWRKVAPVHFINELSNRPDASRTEIVVILQALAADINVGYHEIRNLFVSEINGKKIRDFNDAFNTIMSAEDPFIVLKNSQGFEIVIDREEANANQQKILNNYRIKADRSLDLFK